MDRMQKETDAELAKLERLLKREYKKAQAEVEERAVEYFKAFRDRDDAMLKRLREGKITADEYYRWRQNQMLVGNRWVSLRDRLADDYVTANVRASGMINEHLYNTYAENFNYQAFIAEREMRIETTFSLYDKDAVREMVRRTPGIITTAQVNIAKNQRWNAQKVTSALTQGILQGDSIGHIADRLQTVTTMNQKAAVRNARTLTTGAENGGRFACSQRLESAGVEQEKQWMATLDRRTRHSHRMLDMETVPMDQPFSNGLMYPGDMSMAHTKPEEVYNCRCRYVTQFKKWPSTFERSTDALGESYEDWKNGKSKSDG